MTPSRPLTKMAFSKCGFRRQKKRNHARLPFIKLRRCVDQKGEGAGLPLFLCSKQQLCRGLIGTKNELSSIRRNMLERSKFREIVMHTPLIAIDLVVRDSAGKVLIGLRKNGPAKSTWFVPGGRILKDERIRAAFARITATELGTEVNLELARFLGVYEHLYTANFADEPGFGTHYVILAHEIQNFSADGLPSAQHSDYRWLHESELLADPAVHAYTKAYFTPQAA